MKYILLAICLLSVGCASAQMTSVDSAMYVSILNKIDSMSIQMRIVEIKKELALRNSWIRQDLDSAKHCQINGLLSVGYDILKEASVENQKCLELKQELPGLVEKLKKYLP